MSGTTMSVGSSAQGAVGNTAQVVGNTASDFYKAVMPAVFMATVLDVAQDRSGPQQMMPGQGLAAALGTSAELYAVSGSKLGGAMLETMAEVGIVGALLKLGTSSSTTPDQQVQAQTAEENRLAALRLEDANKQEALAEEDRRRAFFAKPPSMG